MSHAITPSSLTQTNQWFRTLRRDSWWVEPVFTVVVLVLFAIYGTWAALQNANFEYGNYISPFYSPNVKEIFPQWAHWISFSPSFFVMWIPLGFRGTCYFYRRAYYRSFFWDPPACAVGEARTHSYKGERKFPFVLVNFHRYFFYFALLLTIFHWYHAYEAIQFGDKIGFGVGTAVIWFDTLMLTLYVLSCHSYRHFIGGILDKFSGGFLSRARYDAWMRQSKLNEHHMEYAWISLFAVGFADFYVRMVASGVWQDYHVEFFKNPFM